MIACGEEELICDLAETYNIYDYKSLPVDKVAVFSVGLRADSRIYRKMSGHPISDFSERLLALILDGINGLCYGLSSKKGETPDSVYALLFKHGEDQKSDVMSFESGEEFEETRRRILNGYETG